MGFWCGRRVADLNRFKSLLLLLKLRRDFIDNLVSERFLVFVMS
jgi:hypothetical protein